MSNEMLKKWEPKARALDEAPTDPKVPLHVLLGEAIDVARFFEAHYTTQRDAQGRETRAGLEQAVSGGQFRQALGEEIIELQAATQAAQTQYLLIVSAVESPMERAEFVLNELRSALEFVFDDGVEDEEDLRLDRLAQVHPSPTSQDALAAALNDYAGLAELNRDRLSALGAFDTGMIDEAAALAASLRDQSANKLAGKSKDEQKRAHELRSRLAAMLFERMQIVRSAARYVFRHDPKIVRRVTSQYQRQRTARYRRGRGAQDAAAGGLGAAEQSPNQELPSQSTVESPS